MDLPVDLYLPNLKGVVLVIDRVLDFYPLSGGLPVVVKDVHTEQFALTVWAKSFKMCIRDSTNAAPIPSNSKSAYSLGVMLSLTLAASILTSRTLLQMCIRDSLHADGAVADFFQLVPEVEDLLTA